MMQTFSDYITESYTPLQISMKGEIWDSAGDEETGVPFAFRGVSILAIAKAVAEKVDTLGQKKPVLSLKSLSIHGQDQKFDLSDARHLNDCESLVNFMVMSYSTKWKKKEELHVKFDLDFPGYKDEDGEVDADYEYSDANMEPHAKGRTAEEFATNAAKEISRAAGHHGFHKMTIERVTLLSSHGNAWGYGNQEIIRAMVASKCSDVFV